MDCHPIQTNWCPHLYHPHHFYTECPSWHNPPNLSWLGRGTKYAGLHTGGLSILPRGVLYCNINDCFCIILSRAVSAENELVTDRPTHNNCTEMTKVAATVNETKKAEITVLCCGDHSPNVKQSKSIHESRRGSSTQWNCLMACCRRRRASCTFCSCFCTSSSDISTGYTHTDIQLLSPLLKLYYNCNTICLQCFDAVGWAAGRASGL